MFLLKGHEDPRQDERVMQLFGLINTLLLHQADTCRRNLTIQVCMLNVFLRIVHRQRWRLFVFKKRIGGSLGSSEERINIDRSRENKDWRLHPVFFSFISVHVNFIKRYSIVALSHNSGLIGWVPNCDTLHSLIRDYREKRGILLSLEHKLMQGFANELDQLSLLQKVQVSYFECCSLYKSFFQYRIDNF